jgi:hypothetical protein
MCRQGRLVATTRRSICRVCARACRILGCGAKGKEKERRGRRMKKLREYLYMEEKHAVHI